MKRLFMTAALLLGMLAPARASLFIQGSTGQIGGGSSLNAAILDGNPAVVTASTMDLSSAGLGPSLSSLTLTLYITGGQNNGLFGWLVAPNGTAVTLMNQPGYAADGFGATGAGMNITLMTSGAADGNIQDTTSGSVLMGDYNSASSFAGLNGSDPNGLWMLYFSDTISGGGNSTLNGWSLDITAVPEPVNVALGIFAAIFVAMSLLRFFRTAKNA